jgi:hypothetical protein
MNDDDDDSGLQASNNGSKKKTTDINTHYSPALFMALTCVGIG